jgi:hypothetical protein
VDRIRKPGEVMRLLYFGTADPRAYITHWRSMKPDELRNPYPSLYVVSVHRLNRLIHSEKASWSPRFQPIGTIGKTYLIYDFRPHSAQIGSGDNIDSGSQGLSSAPTLR